MLFRRTRPGKPGFSIIEILVVVTLIGTMAVMSAGIFPGVITYFNARRSMEVLLWNLRKVQQKARSRGHAAGAVDPAVFGLRFYAGHVESNGATMVAGATGLCYLPYGPRLDEPNASLAALSPEERALVINLDPAIAPPATLPNRIQFTQNVEAASVGAPPNSDLVPDAGSGNATGLVAPNNFIDFPMLDGSGNFRITLENQRFFGLAFIPAT